MKKRIFIVAGEESGDLHGSMLIRALKQLNPEIEFLGIGGAKMCAEGLNSLFPLGEVAFSGFWEVARHYFKLKHVLDRCKKELISFAPDVFVGVDYPGFNLRISQFAKENGIPAVHYIAPQLWAWGKNRGKHLNEKLDKLLVIFPFEERFFRELGVSAEFVGHPLLDNPVYSGDFPDFSERKKQIAILPGSRIHELKAHLPLVKETILLLKQELPDYAVKMALPERFKAEFAAKIDAFCELSSSSTELMLESRAGIVKTGTSNLEAALCGMPFAMFYKTSHFTYLMGKRLVNLNYLSLVNILRNQALVPELIQRDATPRKIVDSIKEILKDTEKYASVQQEFRLLKSELGAKGAAANAAKSILGVVNN